MLINKKKIAKYNFLLNLQRIKQNNTMKKIISLFLILFFNTVSSQLLTDKDKDFLNAIKVTKTVDSDLKMLFQATLSWDFESLNKESKKPSIEIVSLYDCFHEINGNQIAKTQFLANEPNQAKGSVTFKHLEMKTKCFKWRLVITENNEVKTSEWFFFSFLN